MKNYLKVFPIFLLLLPSQLSYHFWPNFAFVNGLRIDYLSPTIFLTDLIFIAFILTWLIIDKPKIKINKTHIALLLLVIANISFSLSPISSFLEWIRIGQAILLFLYVRYLNITFKKLSSVLALTMIFIALLSLAQFIIGRNVGGLMFWFGERPLNINQPGVALSSLFGQSFLRPYATFPHPNALAGFAGLLLVLSLTYMKSLKKLILVTLFVTTIIVVLLTNSQAVWIAIIFSLLLISKKISLKVLLTIAVVSSLISPLLFRYISLDFGSSITQRIDLSILAGKVISDYPITGVGLRQFVRTIPIYTTSTIWWIQPVHNVFLQLASEIGILGITVFFVYLLKQNFNKYISISVLGFILITGIVDHYWLTSHQNLMLLAIVFGTIKNNDFDNI